MKDDSIILWIYWDKKYEAGGDNTAIEKYLGHREAWRF